MRKVSPLICKKYKSPVFHNTEDLNQLKSYKDYTLKGFVCKGNELFSNCQINPNKKSLLASRLKRNLYYILLQNIMEKTYCKSTKKN
jgi:hypothetical protein